MALADLPIVVKKSLTNQISKKIEEKLKILLNTPATYIESEEAAEMDHVFKNLESFIKCFPSEFHMVKEL